MLNFKTFTNRFAMPLWKWYAGGIALLVVVNLINLRIPQLAKSVINDAASGVGLADARGRALAVVGLGLAMIVIRSLSRIAIFWPGRRVEADAKSYFFARILRLPEAFYDRFGMGDLISRLSADVGQLRAFFAFGILQIFNATMLLLFTIVQMASVHAGLTAACLAPLGLAFFITRWAMPKFHLSSKANQEALGELTNRVTEAFVNVHVLQANAVVAPFVDRLEAANEAVYATNMRMVYVRNLLFPLTTTLAGVSQLVVLFYGGNEILAHRLTVGDLLAFNVYLGLLIFPLTALGFILALYQRAKTALIRLSDIDAAEPEARVESTAARANAPTGAPSLLSVKDLSWAYGAGASAKADDQQFGLKNITFTVERGKRLGITGPIGSGKTTLFNLLVRLLEPPAGAISMDGIDALEWEPRDLRRRAGYALQSVHLYSATVRENLAFGLEPPPPEASLSKAAADAEILDEIVRMPDGWETPIGEKGVRLSGGQKQRLALARLLLRKAPLLILDDALSAVDQSTEQRLLDRLFGLDAALIVASHRAAALRRCDEVLLLSGGTILDRGSFAELAKRHPHLANA